MNLANSQKEELINCLLAMYKAVEGMRACFTELMPLLDEEVAAIKASNLAEIELLTVRKSDLGQGIADNFASIIKTWESLRVLHQRVTGEKGEHVHGSLASALDWFQVLGARAIFTTLERQVYDKTLADLGAAHTKLQDMKATAKPKIDMNIYLTSKLLKFHRESQRFWQDLANEAYATYGAGGQGKKPSENVSMFQVKA